MTDEELQQKVRARAEQLALSFDSTTAIAQRLAEFIREIAPERLGTAYWLTVDGDPRQDKGIDVMLYEHRLPKLGGRLLRLSGLLGAWSAGLLISTPIYEGELGKVAVGIGAVTRYADLRLVSPVVSLSVRF